MTSRRLATALAAVVLAVMALLPATAMAAVGPDVTGIVTADGKPVEGVTVAVVVAGNDMVFTAVTDAKGAWAVTAGIAVGQTVQVSVTGPTTQSSPDPEGCVTSSTRVGKAEVKVEALPLPAVTVALDATITSTVCAATATPHPATHRPGPTPPATDAGTGSQTGGPSTLVLTLGLAAIAWLAVGPVARRNRRRS